MKYLNRYILIGGLIFAAAVTGCGPKREIDREATSSAIRAAEEAGAASVPSASLYLQMAKEELEIAKKLAANGEPEEAESMLRRAQADGELAVALSHSEADKKAAAEAVERVRLLKKDNQLPLGRK